MPEEISLLYHWGTQGTAALPKTIGVVVLTDTDNFLAPLRLFLSLSAVLYCALLGSSSQGTNKSVTASRAGDGIINDIFFTFAFVEMVTWFWIWVTLREERQELVKKSLKDKHAQKD